MYSLFFFLPQRCLFFTFICLLTLSLGCGKKNRFESPFVDIPKQDSVLNFQDFKRITIARSPERELFWARSSVKLTQVFPEKQKNRFDTTLIYGQPDRMRVRGTHFLLGTLFELILDGDNAFVYITDDKRLFEGSLQELQETGGALGSFTPKDLIGAVRVYHRLQEFFDSPSTKGKWATTQAKEHLYLILREPNRTLVWKIRKTDGLVQELLVSNPGRNNQLMLQVLYWKYETPENAEPYPTKLDIIIPEQEITLEFDVNEIKLNPNLKPEVITLLPREIKQRLPMNALAEQAPVLPEDQE
ncbi:MAG: DUF4292 domain-containing protein [Sumerlaeia bacterium]